MLKDSVNIVAYGSLLHPVEIRREFSDVIDCIPVWVYGMKRHYGQQSEWRKDSEGDSGNVLTVDRHSGSRFNGVLLKNVPTDSLQSYMERERGYNICCFPGDLIKRFPDGSIDVSWVFIPVGENAWRINKWNPLEGYMERCERGALEWGQEFYKSFLDTTYKYRESPVKPHPYTHDFRKFSE